MSKLRTNLNEIKIPSFRITKILVIILIFFITLQSFYYEKIGASIFPLVGSLGLFILAIKVYLRRVDKKILSKFIIFFLFAVFLNVLVGIVDLFLMHNYKNIFSAIFNLIAMFSVFLIFHRDKDKLYQVLGSVVALHLFFFYFQVAVWFVTDYYIDYVYLLSDDTSSYSSFKGIVLFDRLIPRFTGLFNEPSTYATYFFTIFSVYYLIYSRVNWFFILALLSLLITMTILGSILALPIILFSFFKKYRKSVIIIYLSLITIFLFFNIKSIYNRIFSKFLELDYRFNAIENIFRPEVFLFGKISGQSCGYDVEISLITNIICKGGIFYGLGFLAVLFFSYSFSSFTFFIFVSSLLISKLKLTYPLLWIYITIIFIISNFVSRPVNKDLLRGYSKTSD